MKRRLTAMLLSAAMVLSLTAFPAGAADSDGEDEHEGILEEYAETSAGFFYWLSVTKGDRDAYNAYLLLTTGGYGSTDITGSRDGEYYAATELGNEGDATSLENLQAAIQWIEKCNALRQSDDNSSGLNDLTVSSLLMAIAELNVNWSCTNMDHAGVFGTADNVDGENLAYGYADPFDSWYTNEKETYDSSASGDTDEYTNIISSGYEATGFACCSKGRYSITCSQVFSSSSSCAIYTVAEYGELLDEYTALVEEYLSGQEEHTWSNPAWTWSDDFSTATATFTCTECGKEETVEASVSSVTEEATCTEAGETIYTASVTFDRSTFTDTQSIELPASGHSYSYSVTLAATCTENGLMTRTCTVCGQSMEIIIYTDGHSYGKPVWTWAEDYSSASALFTCEVCGETLEVEAEISSEEQEDGTTVYTAYAILEDAAYTDKRTLEYSMDYAVCLQDEDCPIYSYSDADPTAWYHNGVHFCIENDLMNGTGSSTFEPSTATTRAMIVTMLYRLAGSPDVSGHITTFNDVVAGSWYVDAVIWAQENEIANGYDNGDFGVNDSVTREQLAAFFYRYAVYYAGLDDGSASTDLSDYPDADEVSSWAETELSWAVAEGLITGQGSGSTSYLSPGSDAARSETATILMRFIVNIVME